MQGFYRASADSDVMVRCPNAYACLPGDEESPLGSCQTGYEGYTCAQCAPGYWQSLGSF